MNNISEIKNKIVKKAVGLGFKNIGITDVNKPSNFDFYKKWLKKGYHGSMTYLSRSDRVERRGNLNKILDGAKSVIVFLYPYENNFFLSPNETKEVAVYSNYSFGLDYHKIIEAKLMEMSKFIEKISLEKSKCYVDTGPILERNLASNSGLGFIGKNTMLIEPDFGSNFFIAEILTTLDLPKDSKKYVNKCGRCQKCISKCPTGALMGPYEVNSNLCISYLTIEYRGVVPLEIRNKIGNHIFGCDICQMVCPWNSKVKIIDDFNEILSPYPFKLKSLLELDEKNFKKIFNSTPIYRIGFERFLRNVVVAAGNSFDINLIGRLEYINKNGPELASKHASWAIENIYGASNL